MYAVWKSKHMIKMAKFQAKSGMFAGLLFPYVIPVKGGAKKKKNAGLRTAILGGGDIGFPLIFAGVILKHMGFIPALVVVLFTALALFGLLTLGSKKKFYPAMPFISIGCLVGYGVAYLLL
jgi:presenilin-like A22 family membrane protease